MGPRNSIRQTPIGIRDGRLGVCHSLELDAEGERLLLLSPYADAGRDVEHFFNGGCSFRPTRLQEQPCPVVRRQTTRCEVEFCLIGFKAAVRFREQSQT